LPLRLTPPEEFELTNGDRGFQINSTGTVAYQRLSEMVLHCPHQTFHSKETMLSSRPIVSAIMPVFNGGSALQQAVASVLAQTCRDFELIVIDDCSTDGCCDFIEDLSDQRIRLIRISQNMGAAASRNAAIELAAGKYVAIADADDIALPDRFATQIAYLESRPDVDLLAGASQSFDDQGLIGRPSSPLTTHTGLALGLRYGSSIVHSTVMVRRTALVDIGGFRTEAEPAEDYDMYARLLMSGHTLAALPNVVLLYRVHALGISKTRAEEGTASARLTRARIRESTDIPPLGDLVKASWSERTANGSERRLRMLKLLGRVAMSKPKTPWSIRLRCAVASLAAGPSTWFYLAITQIRRTTDPND
jgi:glycosyltransferase involved in cell wall biosynthesis